MFGLGPLASKAFNALWNLVTPTPPPTVIVTKGGIKKRKEEIKKSKRAEMQEHIKTLFEVPEIAEDIKEDLQGYVKPSQGLSPYSLDYGKLAQDLEIVQRIIAKANEIRQEQEDEAILLMLM